VATRRGVKMVRCGKLASHRQAPKSKTPAQGPAPLSTKDVKVAV